ncbi:MAG: hypothetical protein ACETVZ_06690 [Phycisphaerae bacterium]
MAAKEHNCVKAGWKSCFFMSPVSLHGGVKMAKKKTTRKKATKKTAGKKKK